MKKIIIALGILAALGVVAAGWIAVMTPPLSIEYRQGKVVAHFETLGDYPTTIRRIRIEEVDAGAVVFEAEAQSEPAQIYSLELKGGENPANLLAEQSSAYRVAVPRSAHFVLRTDRRYRISVWGDGWPPSRAKVVTP